jgi:endoglucanase
VPDARAEGRKRGGPSLRANPQPRPPRGRVTLPYHLARSGLVRAVAVALLLAAGIASCSTTSTADVHVSGNRLFYSNGAVAVLHGVDMSGTEYACVQDHGIFVGPHGPASIAAMRQWNIDAVRIPLNEACWNADRYVKAKYAGTTYRNAIIQYVHLLNKNGMVVMLDLHWTDGTYTGPSSGCSFWSAMCEKPMPDARGAVPFWSSVALTFKDNDGVIFDLFNEPFPDRAITPAAAAWSCWLNGGNTCSSGIHYRVAGMQELVDTIRATGADNVIMLAGLSFSNDLTGWLAFEPYDPDHNLVASWHSYNFNSCNDYACWQPMISSVVTHVPVIASEIGENDCTDGYINRLMKFLDAEPSGYLAWAWNSQFKCSGRSLIKNDQGAPTAYGLGYRSHLQELAN